MKIEISIDEDVNKLLNSLEKIVELTENINFIAQLPLLKINDNFLMGKLIIKKI